MSNSQQSGPAASRWAGGDARAYGGAIAIKGATSPVGRLGVQDLVDGRDEYPGRPVDCPGHRARRVAELAGDLGRRQAGEDLRVVLGAGQDVVIGDVEERDSPGLVGAVDVRGHVEG